MALRLAAPGWTMSSSTTGTPALATWAAMPAPMTPAPITATLRISAISHRLQHRGDALAAADALRGQRVSAARRASSSDAALPVMRAPVAPSGWPSAMAPPSILTLAGSSSRSRMQASDWAAKASFSSTTSSVAGVDAGARQRLARGADRADAHDLRRAAGDGDRFDAGQRSSGRASRHSPREQTSTADGAVGQRRGGAGGDACRLGVEGRLQPGQRLRRWCRARMQPSWSTTPPCRR